MIIASDRNLLLAQSALQNGVRQSDSLQAGGVREDEVYRVIRALGKYGLLDKLSFLLAPNGYVIDANNGIEEVKPLIPGHISATQVTAGDRPQVTRRDDRQNLVTHSRLPGTLGATSPDGFSSADFSTGSPEGELVASDDGSDDHQAFKIPALTDERRMLQQSQEVVQGMRLIVACKVELNNWTGGANRAVHVAGVSWTIGSGKDLSTLVSGEWGFREVTADSTGTGFFRFGVGPNSPASSDGDTRISRPMVAHRPPDWDEKSDAEKQTWLDDHYAASGTNYQEFAGYRGMRAPYFSSQEFSPTFQQGDVDELTWAVFANYLTNNSTGVRFLHSGADNPLLFIDGFGRFRFQAEDESLSATIAALSSVASENYFYKPVLVTGTAKAGGRVKLYINGDDEVIDGGALASLKTVDGNLRIGFSAHDRPWWLAWGFLYDREFTADDVINLNAIIRGDLS